MLISGLDLTGTPVLGLQTGTELAMTKKAVINPHDLSVAAYEVEGPLLDQEPSLLRIQEIREISSIGLIIDSSDDFTIPDDVIKLKDIYELRFDLIGKPVLDEQRHKLGKISDYTLEPDHFSIQQLTIKRPLLKSFNDPELIVHRSQVIEVSDEAVIITSKANANKPLPKSSRAYTNPFRQPAPQPNNLDTNAP